MSRVEELVHQFETRTVRLVDFRHAEHLEVALWYLLRLPEAQATEKIRSGLRSLLEAHGVTHGYNEEQTLYWIGRIQAFLRTADLSLPIDQLAHALITACPRSSMLS